MKGEAIKNTIAVILILIAITITSSIATAEEEKNIKLLVALERQ